VVGWVLPVDVRRRRRRRRRMMMMKRRELLLRYLVCTMLRLCWLFVRAWSISFAWPGKYNPTGQKVKVIQVVPYPPTPAAPFLLLHPVRTNVRTRTHLA
jgi:hypothetical protein